MLTPDTLANLPPDRPGSASAVTRIIAAALNPVAFFEGLTPGADIDALLDILRVTSPSLVELVGDPTLVSDADRVYGPGAGWVMPAFTRRVRESRFTAGRYGVWYAAQEVETAIAETMYHTRLRLLETDEPAQEVAMQVLTADLAGFAAVLTRLDGELDSAVHDPNSYDRSQIVGRALRDRGSEAIVYRSVRRAGGICYGVLKPRSVRNCIRTGYVSYLWNRTSIRAGPVTP